MDNRALKAKIERVAIVMLKTTSHKCDSFEGYVTAYATDCETFKVKGKHYFRGTPVKETSAFGGRTAAQAVRKALLRMADALGVAVTDDDANAVERANQADFDARTK